MRVTRSQQSTNKVSQQTLRCRSNAVQKLERIIGGDDSSLILHHELQSLTKEERSMLLFKAGLIIDIPPEQLGLAMKGIYSLE